MGDNADKIQSFIAVTGVNDERARFFLESASWDVELALTSFFDDEGDNSEVDPSPDVVLKEPDVLHSTKSKKSKKTNARFATIHTTIDSSSDEEEEQGQAFYAGGSTNSGQQVLGPPKKKDFVTDMFKSVKEHGVEVLDDASTSGSRAFKGTGYKLGQTENDTEAIPGAPEAPKPVQVSLKLWKDGFSVDNGELRLYTDPSNQDFLNSVRRGEIPHELRRGYSENSPLKVHVSMEDHRMETFSQLSENRSRKVFGGQGHTLGSPTPPTVGAPSIEDREVNETHAREIMPVDSNQPTTSLQIRLADGSRLIGRFNHNHTISQIRTYIVTARPQYETSSFSLLSSFPPKELEDAQTIAGAGLLNAAIIQKLT